QVRELAEAGAALVEGDDAFRRVADRGRHVQHPRPRLAREREHVPHQRAGLLRRIPVAAEPDDLRRPGHAASLGSQEMNDAPSTLTVGGRTYRIHRIEETGLDVARLPYTLRVLLEGVLRAGDDDGVRAIGAWEPSAEPSHEISFGPARILLQDFTGVPAVV